MDGLSAVSATPAESPLAAPEALPVLPPATVATFGPTLVVAPHPDDESLGCGGTIALLARAGLPVHVLFVSDGTGSHRDSPTFPPERLRALREAEAREALSRLGLTGEAAIFLRLPDRFVPWAGQPGFGAAVASVAAVLRLHRPATILLPWRGEHHCDHVASWQIVRAAVEDVTPSPRLLEYPIWLWERAMPHRDPTEREVAGWRLDIGPVLPQKLAAIRAHQSQLTDLIADAQFAFRLEPEFLANFARPWELFLEERPGRDR
jgi:LmbE family N-acetylglucosaminyl deacetylase